ncbi:MAG: uroporphyrinogen-III synthase [Rhodobacteraceae bacterium]|nr:uroporphyrinogen-III synthase [Paracoccaceae bacterium]
MAGNPDITIILTRPKAQADVYARQLKAEFGDAIEVIIAPLLTIRQVAAEFEPGNVSYLMFTSINAVESFAAQFERRDIPCLCVGNRTAETARSHGLLAESADGAADDLLRLAKSRMSGKSGHLHYMRGRQVASDLTTILSQSGFTIHQSIVYEQVGISLSDQTKSALTGDKRIFVPLFSPLTARRLMTETTGLVMPNATAIAISDNAAKLLEPSRFSSVRVARQPTAESITEEIAAII